MKKNQKSNNASTKPNELQGKFYENRYIAWLILIPVLTIIYNQDSLGPFNDFRFLVYTIFLVLYTLFFFWQKKESTNFSLSKSTQLFFIAGFLFSFWSIISSLFSISYYECLLPIAKTFITGLSIFYIMESLTEKNVSVNYFKVFSILALFHALVAILQVSNIAFTELPGGGPPNGFMGNRNLLGSFLAASLCFPAYLAFQSRGTWKWFSTATFFVILLAIILSQTRTAWLSSFAVILMIPTGWLLVNGLKNYKEIVTPVTVGVLGVALVIATTFLFDNNIKKSLGRKLETMTVKDQKVAGDGSARFRFHLWERSLVITKDHPITGVGLGNWKLVIPTYNASGYGFNVVDSGNKVIVKPHNIYVRILSETGVVGFLCFLILLGAIIHAVFKFIIADQDKEEKMVILFLGIGLTTFLIDMLPNFSMSRIEHTVLFSFIIGAILSLSNKNQASGKKILLNNRVLFGSAIIILMYSLTIALSKFDFGKQIKLIKSANSSKNYPAILDYAKSGKSKFSKLDETAAPIEMYTAIAYREQKLFEQAQKEISQALVYHPNSSPVLNTYGTIYLNQGKFKESLPYFERAIELTPNDRAILKNLSKSYYFLEEYQKVLDLLANVDPQNDTDFMTMYRESLGKVMGGN